MQTHYFVEDSALGARLERTALLPIRELATEKCHSTMKRNDRDDDKSSTGEQGQREGSGIFSQWGPRGAAIADF